MFPSRDTWHAESIAEPSPPISGPGAAYPKIAEFVIHPDYPKIAEDSRTRL